MSHLTSHMSGVTCPVSHVRCHMSDFFLTKWWSKLGPVCPSKPHAFPSCKPGLVWLAPFDNASHGFGSVSLCFLEIFSWFLALLPVWHWMDMSGAVQCSTVQCSAVHFGVVPDRARPYSLVMLSAVYCCSVKCSAFSAVHCSVVYCSVAQGSAVQDRSSRFSAVYSVMQCSLVQCGAV